MTHDPGHFGHDGDADSADIDEVHSDISHELHDHARPHDAPPAEHADGHAHEPPPLHGPIARDAVVGDHAPADHDHADPMHIFGDPAGDGFTHQTTGYTCAVVSQKMVLDQFHVIDPATGQPVSEAHLVHVADTHGWLGDHGTSVQNMGKLLDHFGVSNHGGSGWQQLLDDLSRGHQVIVPVNADNLWSHHSPLFLSLERDPNHALVLKGVKIDDEGHIAIVVNDPGQQHGAGVQYSLEHFRAALDGKQFHYVATDHAAPGWDVVHLADAGAGASGDANSTDASNAGVQHNFDNPTPIVDALSEIARRSAVYSFAEKLKHLKFPGR